MATLGSSSSTQTATAIGSTTLPKVPLSYKWIINDAKVFLKNCKVIKSPEFSLQLPLKLSHSASCNSIQYGLSTSVSWHLALQRVKVASPLDHIQITLCQGNRSDNIEVCSCNTRLQSHSLVVSDCEFSILHPDTSEALFTTSINRFRCGLSESVHTCCSTEKVSFTEVIKYVVDRKLIVEINAMLLCIDDPIEMVAVAHKVPMDNIRSEMHRLYKDEVFADVTIKCGESKFKVHKAILSSQSPVFQTMFEVDMSERNNGVVNVTDTTPTVMSDLVSYFYTGIAPNINKLAKKLIDAAKKYELPRLFRMCENELKMKISIANVVNTIILADLYDAALLKKACLKFIYRHSAEVHKTNDWKCLKEDLNNYGQLLIEILEYKP